MLRDNIIFEYFHDPAPELVGKSKTQEIRKKGLNPKA